MYVRGQATEAGGWLRWVEEGFDESLSRSAAAGGYDNAMETAVDSTSFAAVMKAAKEEGRMSVLGTSAHPSYLVLGPVPVRARVHAGYHRSRHASMRRYSVVGLPTPKGEDQPQRLRLQDLASIAAPNRNQAPGFETEDDLAYQYVLARSNGQLKVQGHDVSFLQEGAGYAARDRTLRQRDPSRRLPLNHVLPLQAVGQHEMFWIDDAPDIQGPHHPIHSSEWCLPQCLKALGSVK